MSEARRSPPRASLTKRGCTGFFCAAARVLRRRARLAFFNPLAAIAFLASASLGIVGAYWKLLTTRISITPKQVIYRTGYVARRTVEMNKDKIELIDVNAVDPRPAARFRLDHGEGDRRRHRGDPERRLALCALASTWPRWAASRTAAGDFGAGEGVAP